MGLGLTFKAGDDFYVNDERFIVARINDPTSFVVRRDKDGTEFTVTERDRQEIWPQVFASANLSRDQWGMARLDLTGPRSVVFATGSNYRKAGAQGAV